jgi:hypothetical protein
MIGRSAADDLADLPGAIPYEIRARCLPAAR